MTRSHPFILIHVKYFPHTALLNLLNTLTNTPKRLYICLYMHVCIYTYKLFPSLPPSLSHTHKYKAIRGTQPCKCWLDPRMGLFFWERDTRSLTWSVPRSQKKFLFDLLRYPFLMRMRSFFVSLVLLVSFLSPLQLSQYHLYMSM